ncbi:MAG: SulP family inorganic anion transporter [Bacteroidia bacterium]|jgi:MFS superfamily sulfate permease-like transporter
MKRTLKYYRIVWLKHDLPAGLSVFLVALPLCLGIALASGAPLYAGLISGMIGGLVVSLISGSQLAVSGPAAGLTGVVAATIISLGDYRLFLLAVVVAGLFQLLLGILRLGAIANYFPSSVIKGMLAAIGILLISKQIPFMIGYDEPDFWTSTFLNLFSEHSVNGLLHHLRNTTSRGTVVVTIFSLFVYWLLQRPFAQQIKAIPAPLFIVLVGVLVNLCFELMVPGFSLKDNQLVNITDNIFLNIEFPDLSMLFSNAEIWKSGLIIGLLATLETLLCIEAIDKLDRRNRITPVNRELVAQGIGNMACGMVGAIPMTAVVVRGAANIDAGAKTKFSAFTHGLFLVMAVMLVPFVLNKIPFASLSVILFFTGYNLSKPKLFINMWQLGLKQFLPFMITIVVILLTDLLIGVSIGLLISVYFIVQNNFKAEYKISKTTYQGIESYVLALNSNVTFLNKVKLRKVLDEVPEYSKLIIDGEGCNFIDYDILEIISEYDAKAREKHIDLHLKGIERVNVTAIH